MTNTQYKNFEKSIIENGLSKHTWCGFMFLALTQKQINKVIDIAIQQGYTINKEGVLSINDSIILRRL